VFSTHLGEKTFKEKTSYQAKEKNVFFWILFCCLTPVI